MRLKIQNHMFLGLVLLIPLICEANQCGHAWQNDLLARNRTHFNSYTKAIHQLAILKVRMDTAAAKADKIEIQKLKPRYKEALRGLVGQIDRSTEDMPYHIIDYEVQRLIREQILELRYFAGPESHHPRISERQALDEIGHEYGIEFATIPGTDRQIQDSPITQRQWELVVELYRTYGMGQQHESNIQLATRPSADYKPNHPVTNISKIEIEVWVFQLNRLIDNKVAELSQVIPDLFRNSQRYTVGLPVQEDYEQLFQGRFPFQNPVMKNAYDFYERPTRPVRRSQRMTENEVVLYDLADNVDEILDHRTTDLYMLRSKGDALRIEKFFVVEPGYLRTHLKSSTLGFRVIRIPRW